VATIRIYNLAGVLVKTIYKNDNTQFATWNLRNESDLPVASGIYVIYVDMGNLGTKILKFAMVQQQTGVAELLTVVLMRLLESILPDVGRPNRSSNWRSTGMVVMLFVRLQIN